MIRFCAFSFCNRKLNNEIDENICRIPSLIGEKPVFDSQFQPHQFENAQSFRNLFVNNAKSCVIYTFKELDFSEDFPMFRKPLTLRNSNQVNKIDLNYSIKPTNRENSIPKPKDSHKKQNVSNSTLTENAGAHSEDKTNVLSRNEKVKVFLRMRKLLTGENSICFNISSNNIVVHPNSQSPTSKFCMDKSFTFRQIFDEKASQLNVFENVALPLLPDFLDGNDVLIFCYGSTNAGKTYRQK